MSNCMGCEFLSVAYVNSVVVSELAEARCMGTQKGRKIYWSCDTYQMGSGGMQKASSGYQDCCNYISSRQSVPSWCPKLKK